MAEDVGINRKSESKVRVQYAKCTETLPSQTKTSPKNNNNNKIQKIEIPKRIGYKIYQNIYITKVLVVFKSRLLIKVHKQRQNGVERIRC